MSAGEYKLDDADRRILRVLQQDGRITNQDLAAACNMSAHPVSSGCAACASAASSPAIRP
jgi:hypothetical protein